MRSQLTRGRPRFKALERALVLPQGADLLPYHIIDISDGGLSFRYIGKKIKKKQITPVSLYHGEELIVGDLPAKVVSDLKLRDNFVPVRRGSLCFGSLSIEQRDKLSIFIEQFTEH